MILTVPTFAALIAQLRGLELTRQPMRIHGCWTCTVKTGEIV